jgi:hypothetical protein
MIHGNNQKSNRLGVGSFEQKLHRVRHRLPDPLPDDFMARLLQSFAENPDFCRAFSETVKAGVREVNDGN